MSHHATTSLPKKCLSCTAALALALCALPAIASATPPGHRRTATAEAARTHRTAQARADRRLQRVAQRLQRRTARQAQRAARRTEREERAATRAAERAQRLSAALDSAPAPAEATAPAGTGETTQTEPEAPPLLETRRGACSVSATARSPQVTAGESVTISGKLTCPSPTDSAEQELTVYQHASGSTTTVGTATTEADGSYRFQSAALGARGIFIVRYAGAPHGARVVIPVVADVSLQGPALDGAALPMSAGRAAGGPAKVTFTGIVNPGEAGRQVALKVRYADGEWRTVAYARTDAEGRYTFSHGFRFAGQVSVIAGARPRGTERTKSQMLTYTIVQAQNPALTLRTSTAASGAAGDAVAAGEPATLTGVAANARHKTVTLLARTTTGRFTRVATVQSDDVGAYSFTVDPPQTTIYQVVCRRSRSAVVLLAVS